MGCSYYLYLTIISLPVVESGITVVGSSIPTTRWIKILLDLHFRCIILLNSEGMFEVCHAYHSRRRGTDSASYERMHLFPLRCKSPRSLGPSPWHWCHESYTECRKL